MAVTYETLFEILRREKNHEDLQKLDAAFFSDITAYLEEKIKKTTEKPRLDQFVEGYEQEQAALRTQLNNIRKIVRDIFDRREQKIIHMAVNKAKTGSNIIDTSALLPEELPFFEEQVRIIGVHRGTLLDSALHIRKAPKAPQTALEAPSEPQDLNMAHSESNTSEPNLDESNWAQKSEAFLGLKKVHILESVPKFVGVDLEIYGPFDSNEELTLHPAIAEMLVKTNKAKVIE